MISVFDYGSCVSRGIFDLHRGGKSFAGNEYIAKSSIFGLYSVPVHLAEFVDVSNPHDI